MYGIFISESENPEQLTPANPDYSPSHIVMYTRSKSFFFFLYIYLLGIEYNYVLVVG